MQGRKGMSKYLERLEKDLRFAVHEADYYLKKFKEYEEIIIDLKKTINDIKELQGNYHDHSRCL